MSSEQSTEWGACTGCLCVCLWENQSKLFEYLIIIKFKLNKNCLQSCDGILCHHIKKGSYNRRTQTCYSCYFNPRNGSFVSALSREADWVESVCDSGSFISINYSQWRLLNTLYLTLLTLLYSYWQSNESPGLLQIIFISTYELTQIIKAGYFF